MINLDIMESAKDSDVLDAARNGATGRRSRRAVSLRLPPDLWDELKRAQSILSAVFPDKYVTTNSTIEFLLRMALKSFWSTQTSTPVFVEEE
jgi:hypothetical protein